ncbi:MAG: hypothetical protein U5N58_08520 [Actinomycetota bacterium]|nr:hypothetical protein [Actinomycetota bacterium]
MAKAIFTGKKILDGEIFIKGNKVLIKSIQNAIKNSLAYIPENRKTEGLILELSVKKNISLPIIKKISTLGFLKLKTEKRIAEKFKNALNIKTPDIIGVFLVVANYKKKL